MSTFTQEMVLERELAVALDLWFMSAMVSPSKRRASPVWAVMRNRLKVLGYWQQLQIIIGNQLRFSLLHATAAQRAEALLKTIGKWEEKK